MMSIETGNEVGHNFVVDNKIVKFVNFEQVVDEVWVFSIKGSVQAREVTTAIDEQTLDIRTVDIPRYISSTARAEDVEFELLNRTEGSGALRTYKLNANGRVSSKDGTNGQSVSVRTESEFSRVIGLDRDGGFSLNGDGDLAGIMQLSADDGGELTVSVSPNVPVSKRLIVDYSLLNADGTSSEQTGVEFVDLTINVEPEDPR